MSSWAVALVSKEDTEMHYYTRHIGDYAKDTKHLSLIEHGAYTLLLDWCYATERTLPKDDVQLFRLCNAFSKSEQAAVMAVVEEFFEMQEDGYFHKRIALEVSRYQERSNKMRENVSKRKDRSSKNNSNESESTKEPTIVDTKEPTIVDTEVIQRARVPNNQEPRTNPPTVPQGGQIAQHRASPSAGAFADLNQIIAILNKIFDRKRPWSSEEQHLITEQCVTLDEARLMARYFKASQIDENQRKLLSQQIVTLLRNWPGQLDAARAYLRDIPQAENFGEKKTGAENSGPAGWQDILQKIYPGSHRVPWHQLDDDVRSKILEFDTQPAVTTTT
jgi:uncharacterized protein YdaU (DUF1376 family)